MKSSWYTLEEPCGVLVIRCYISNHQPVNSHFEKCASPSFSLKTCATPLSPWWSNIVRPIPRCVYKHAVLLRASIRHKLNVTSTCKTNALKRDSLNSSMGFPCILPKYFSWLNIASVNAALEWLRYKMVAKWNRYSHQASDEYKHVRLQVGRSDMMLCCV